ncbi:sugar ABC transporter ATP-binding protein [Vibrio sp. S9_S30]|uniref:sugar ABC transporter ATP-binding protein n=1 Tax=Vibrio sp. S9_S30 TaxID=2720226 RepID=UPI001680E84C|nr:sugar ABC transporter ATP-binding protein [Vibrio sp. S9_S30]MBD1555630.1 sugar ABC transporter ATP-binding protein [Vibrio sp. S9_S30]
MTEYVLQATGIKKTFSGVVALKRGDLNLRKGTIHALCGGNGAGKSTFLNVLMGIYARDEGEILLNSLPVKFSSPSQALKAGISFISQELEPVPDMTVAENIYLGREPKKFGGFVVDKALMEGNTSQLLHELKFDISANAFMRELSLSQIQLVEIAKAISYNARIIIMDEPTSAIGEQEVNDLFDTMRQLKASGTSIIYVSHRMNELFRIADDYSIFRDGQFIQSGAMKDINHHELINLILGSELEEEYAKFNQLTDRPLLRVHQLALAEAFSPIDLTLHQGEILGVFGLMGAGRSEFLETLFGLREPSQGEIELGDERYQPRSPKQAMEKGFALVTEDRKGSGLFLESSVVKNISYASLNQLSRRGVVTLKQEQTVSDEMFERFSIKATKDMDVKSLSGGNQQKVVLAKWMATQPKVLLLDEPTRGVDVGAKREIYQFMSQFAREGKAIILVSSEIPEILGMSDRVIVFRKGKITGELTREALSQEALSKLAS